MRRTKTHYTGNITGWKNISEILVTTLWKLRSASSRDWINIHINVPTVCPNKLLAPIAKPSANSPGPCIRPCTETSKLKIFRWISMIFKTSRNSRRWKSLNFSYNTRTQRARITQDIGHRKSYKHKHWRWLTLRLSQRNKANLRQTMEISRYTNLVGFVKEVYCTFLQAS